MKLVFVLALSLVVFGISNGCTLSNYVDLKLMERLVQTDVVVFGRTMGHTPNRVLLDGVIQFIIDAEVDVHCVLQSAEMGVNERIVVKHIAPRDDCTGTPVTKVMKVGDYAIFGLKKISGDDYELQELMPRTTAVVMAYKPYLFSLASLCTMQQWRTPMDASSNRCPICGTADFPADVMGLYDPSNTMKLCRKTGTVFAFDFEACDLWMDETVATANAQTCVPANFTNTCVTLMYRKPPADASCDCTGVEEVAKKSKTSGACVVAWSASVLMASVGLWLLNLM